MKVYLVTTNQNKLLTAQKALSKYNIDLDMLFLEYEAPEIQAFNVREIASFTAKYLSEKEQKPVLVTDVGYFIKALNGFPGPYIKQMNHYLNSDNLLKLLDGVEDRKFEMVECLAFCLPGKEPVTFLAKSSGYIALNAFGEGSAIDRVIIREGMKDVQTKYSQEAMVEYYSKHLTHYDQFGNYYKTFLSHS